MNHRDRVLTALCHQTADRIPIAMVCSGVNPPARRALTELLERTRGLTVEQYLDPLIDIATVSPRYIGPALADGADHWGVIRRPQSYGSGSYDEIDHYPLASAQSVADLDDHPWPQADWFDYDSVWSQIEQLNAIEPRAIMVVGGNIFERSWYMRGFQRMLTDLYIQPDLFAMVMSRVTAFNLEYARRILDAGRGMIDLVFTADDIGGQRGLLMSLDMWHEHLFPYHAKQNALVHELGARVIYHTDGSVMEAVPGLIEMGIDVLQALQFDADGMDPRVLKSEYGDRLCFEGGVSVQRTLPFGSADEVREETLERIRVLGQNGGYILGPSHAIQAGTPPENILAMFDSASAAPYG